VRRGRQQPPVGVRPRVHGRGEARLDAMLELAEEAGKAAPLADVLSSLCGRIARVLAVDVCSVYLREAGSNELVLAATHGYPEEAVGRVRMRVGEGLTGFAVECLRPVSVARATVDARNRAFPGLDEERFPSLCAVPLVDGGRAVGALVIQRRQPRAFGQREIVLAASVATPVLFALERGRARERERSALAAAVSASASATMDVEATVAARAREVLLSGRGVAPGAALGTVVVRRQARRVARVAATGGGEGLSRDDHRARLGRAIAEAAGEIAALEAWALEQASKGRALDGARLLALFAPARFVLEDARLRGRMLKQVQAGSTPEAAVSSVLAEYTRSLGAAGDPALLDRAHEVEALCLRVLGRLGDSGAPPLSPGAILCAARLTVCDALELAARHGVAAVLAGGADGDVGSGVAVARALGIPVVAAVGELYRWVHDGDRALVDADAGTVVLNPARVAENAFRAARAARAARAK
jgi:phosphotransferase system enzyme I (PtsP)